MKRLKKMFTLLLALCLITGLLPAASTMAGNVDWDSLFANSGWYDEDHSDDEKNEDSDQKNSKQKNSDQKKSNQKNSNKNDSSRNNADQNKSSQDSGAADKNAKQGEQQTEEDIRAQIDEDGTYTSKEEVAAYLYLFGHLPDNYITKKEAKKLGWESSLGNLDEVAPGKSIGGDHFGNYEGQLPEKKGRSYYECDIDYEGGYRGSKRIIFSDDGLIYYTEDHYKTFELLYE